MLVNYHPPSVLVVTPYDVVVTIHVAPPRGLKVMSRHMGN